MTTLLLAAAVVWVVYHLGIEKGRKRAARERAGAITHLDEWRRR